MNRILLLLLLLVLAALGCKYLSPAQKLESESATENPNRTITDSPIFLNNEDFGTIADLNKKEQGPLGIDLTKRKLSEVLADIIKERESNGIFIEGTNVVPTNVYIIADPELAVGPLAELHIAIDENAGDVYIPKKNLPKRKGEPQKPDPFTLEVRTEKAGFGKIPDHHQPMYDPDHLYTYKTSFEFVKSADSLLSYRAWTGSVELSADERYFVNDAQGEAADKGPKYTEVKQRPIEPAALAGELAKIVSPVNKEILIIASEKASYASLLKIFEAAPDTGVKLRILVRRQILK